MPKFIDNIVNKFKKNKSPAKADNEPAVDPKELEFVLLKQKIYESLKSGHQPENAIINYILTQSKDNAVIFATKNGRTYVSFLNEDICTVLNDWFVIVNAYQKEKMSPGGYRQQLNSMLKQYSFDNDKTNS